MKLNEDLGELLRPGTVIRIESNKVLTTYALLKTKSNNTIICRAIGNPISGGGEVGSLLTIKHISGHGECDIPAKITAISGRAEVVALQTLEEVSYVERRDDVRVKAGSNVRIKLQFDSSSSMYKSLCVHDISSGGIGVSIYSRKPVDVGQSVKLGIEFFASQNRINVRGKVTHCTNTGDTDHEYLLGIQFVEISADNRNKISNYVENELRKQREQQRLEEQEKAEDPQSQESETEQEEVTSEIKQAG